MANPLVCRKARSTRKLLVHYSKQANKLFRKQPRELGLFVDMSGLLTLI